MARHWFGGGISEWTFQRADGVDGNDNLAQLIGGAVVTLWNLQSGGTQYLDLLDFDGQSISQVTSSDGSGGLPVGQIPRFQGPDGVWSMWASANGGPRALMVSTDLAELASRVETLEQESED